MYSTADITVIAAAAIIAHSSRRSGPMSPLQRTIARKIATNWTFVLSFPQIDGGKTVPSAATTPRSPRINSSRPTMIAAIQAEARSTSTSAISAPVTSSLSAVVSRNEPSLVVTAHRRAR